MSGRLYPQPLLYLLRWRAELMTGQEVWSALDAARRSEGEIRALLMAAGDTPFWVQIYGMTRGGMLVALEELEMRAPRSVFTGFATQSVH